MTEKQLDSIDHITLTAGDIDMMVDWYTSSFSCEILERSTTEATLLFDNIKLTLVLPSQHPAHIALEKTDAETYGELREQSDGKNSTYVSDPTGNIVELIKK